MGNATDSPTAAINEASVATVPLVHSFRIVNGIEFFTVGHGDDRDEDCQCARCGSSAMFNACDNCGGDGEVEDDDWQCEGDYLTCDWCRGKGGWFRCCSSADWCKANPRPGREDQPVMGVTPHEAD
jgi:hypothetical protein